MMGLHWLDVRSPELQKLTGNPAGYRQFTKTFIYWHVGWPVHLRRADDHAGLHPREEDATDPSVVDELVPVPTAAKYSPRASIRARIASRGTRSRRSTGSR
jgi:hypothetical protein